MQAELPTARKLSINQSTSKPEAADYAAAEAVVVVLPKAALAGRFPNIPQRALLKRRLAALPAPACGGVLLTTQLDSPDDTRVVLACIDDASPFQRLELARKAVAEALKGDPAVLALQVAGLPAAAGTAMAEALASAALAAAASLPKYQKGARTPRLRALRLLGLARTLDLARLRAEAEGNHLARWLTALPPNALRPEPYLALLRRLARREGWKLEFLNEAALARAGAGAFLAVTRGGPIGAGLVRLRYTPARGAKRPPLALVGKGICFDSGGMNLKPARHMHGMHQDMAGSAVALGSLLALSRMKEARPVECWLALAENHIGPEAYRQGDVVTAANGTTIEVVHTDAEGRMVLADALTLASRTKPALLVDYATLTGACIYALGSRYSGAFANRDGLAEKALAAGRASGERVWPFPMDADYDAELESTIADVKQCTLDGEADHILAARFLSRFVEADTPWLHLDLAAAEHKGGLGHVAGDVTGFGVRFTVELVTGQKAAG